MSYTVYMHILPNNKRYIGITKQSLTERFKNSLGYKTQKLFWRAIQKYGWNNIEHKIIAENLSHDDACNLEVELIAKYRTNNPKYGYNCTSGGDGTVCFSHKNPHDAEWRAKVSKANTGKKRTPEAKEKMRQAKLGTHWTEERRREYSKAQKLRGYRPCDEAMRKSHSARIRSVYQYDLDGNLIAKYDSMSDAAIKLNISVAYVSILCSGKQSSNKYILKKGE